MRGGKETQGEETRGEETPGTDLQHCPSSFSTAPGFPEAPLSKVVNRAFYKDVQGAGKHRDSLDSVQEARTTPLQIVRHLQLFLSTHQTVSNETMEEQGVANFQSRPAKAIVRLQHGKQRPLEAPAHANNH